MGKRDKLYSCRSGADFIHYAYAHKADVSGGNGSHIKIRTDKGMVVVPYHTNDLGNGLRCKIIKAFIAIGIGAFLYLIYWANWM
jgi:hypothetical protein